MDNNNVQAGLANINAKAELNTEIKNELKAADNMHNQFGGTTTYNNDNSNQVLQQNFIIAVLPNINVDDAIKKALTAGNENANLVGIDVQKLLTDNNISQDQVNEKLSNPEMIYTLAKANEIAYKTSDTDKRKILSDLIFQKIKEDSDSDDSNILSLAIQEMDILNINHIKALAFLHIMKSNFLKNYTVDALKEFDKTIIVNLLDFKKSNAKNVGKFLSSTRTISDAHLGWGINSYLPQIMKSINNNIRTISEDFIHLSQTWEELGFTGTYITPVGKYIAKSYLFYNFGLLVEDIEMYESNTKDLSDDVSKKDMETTVNEATKNMITFKEINDGKYVI